MASSPSSSSSSSSSPSSSSLLLHLLLLVALCVAAAVSAPSSGLQQSDQLRQLRQKRAHIPMRNMFQRPSRSSSPDDAPDPALQGLTTEELYRMIELLDLVKAGREDKMNSDDLKMLEFLMGQYQA